MEIFQIALPLLFFLSDWLACLKRGFWYNYNFMHKVLNWIGSDTPKHWSTSSSWWTFHYINRWIIISLPHFSSTDNNSTVFLNWPWMSQILKIYLWSNWANNFGSKDRWSLCAHLNRLNNIMSWSYSFDFSSLFLPWAWVRV